MKITNNILHTVHDLLATSPELRNSDSKLIVAVWATLHPHRIFTASEQPVKCFAIKDIMELFESPETIRRSRQLLQNSLGLYPPTNEKVIRHRRMNKELMRLWASIKPTPQQTKKLLTEYLNLKPLEREDSNKVRQLLNRNLGI